MIAADLLPLSILLLGALALMLFVPGIKNLDKNAGPLVSIYLLFIESVVLAVSIPVWSGSVKDVNVSLIWSKYIGLEMSFRIDHLSILMLNIISLISCLTAFYSIKYMEHKEYRAKFFGLYSLFVMGMLGSVISADVLEFLFFWELMLVPTYLMVLFWGTKGRAKRVAVKYFFYTLFGSLFIFVAFALIVYYGGSFKLADIELVFNSRTVPAQKVALIFSFLIVGFGVKMAIAPFHNWLPDAHGEAPTPISVLFSGVMIEIATYAIIRFGLLLFKPYFMGNIEIQMIFEVIGVITVLYASLLALVQTDIKRLLAYSSISHMGIIFMGLAAYNSIGVSGAVFHIVSHAFGKSILFMNAGVLMNTLKTRDIREMGGLSGKMPVLSVIAFIGALNLAGLPPLSGFFSEWLIFTGVVRSATTTGAIFLTVLFLAGSLLSAAYMIRFLWRVFLGPMPEKFKDVEKVHPLYLVPMAILALLIVIVGLWANNFISILLDVGL